MRRSSGRFVGGFSSAKVPHGFIDSGLTDGDSSSRGWPECYFWNQKLTQSLPVALEHPLLCPLQPSPTGTCLPSHSSQSHEFTFVVVVTIHKVASAMLEMPHSLVDGGGGYCWAAHTAPTAPSSGGRPTSLPSIGAEPVKGTPESPWATATIWHRRAFQAFWLQEVELTNDHEGQNGRAMCNCL